MASHASRSSPGLRRVGSMRGPDGLYESMSDLTQAQQQPHSRSFWEEVRRWMRTHPLWPLLPLGWKLLTRMLSTGWLWMWMTLRLVLFSFVLFPAFMRGTWFYFTSSSIRRNVRFGVAPRNLMDIYFPPSPNEAVGKRPVVIFVTGGAWIIGYKAWGALLGRALARAGVIAVLPDYRNYPQGTASDMIHDVDLAITWVRRNIIGFGGDPDRVFLVGQSAGAHLSAMALITRAKRAATSLSLSGSLGDSLPSFDMDPVTSASPDYSPVHLQAASTPVLGSPHEVPSDPSEATDSVTGYMADDSASSGMGGIRAFVGVSGPYDLEQIVQVFHERGLHRSVLTTIFESGLRTLSPTRCVDSREHYAPLTREWLQYMPPVYLIHGGADKTCPVESSLDFASALVAVGGGLHPPVNVRVYDEKSHTDMIIEDLMHEQDDHKDFVGDMIIIIRNELGLDADVVEFRPRRRTLGKQVVGAEDPVPERDVMLPLWVMNLGRWVNPF